MSDFTAAINLYTYLLSFDNLDFQYLNNRGYYKMLKAIEDNDPYILESGICDIELALERFKRMRPEESYDIGQGNLENALNLRADIFNT